MSLPCQDHLCSISAISGSPARNTKLYKSFNQELGEDPELDNFSARTMHADIRLGVGLDLELGLVLRTWIEDLAF